MKRKQDWTTEWVLGNSTSQFKVCWNFWSKVQTAPTVYGQSDGMEAAAKDFLQLKQAVILALFTDSNSVKILLKAKDSLNPVNSVLSRISHHRLIVEHYILKPSWLVIDFFPQKNYLVFLKSSPSGKSDNWEKYANERCDVTLEQSPALNEGCYPSNWLFSGKTLSFLFFKRLCESVTKPFSVILDSNPVI